MPWSACRGGDSARFGILGQRVGIAAFVRKSARRPKLHACISGTNRCAFEELHFVTYGGRRVDTTHKLAAGRWGAGLADAKPGPASSRGTSWARLFLAPVLKLSPSVRISSRRAPPRLRLPHMPEDHVVASAMVPSDRRASSCAVWPGNSTSARPVMRSLNGTG